MKKIVSIIVALLVAFFAFPVNALSATAFSCNIKKDDLSGTTYQLFLMGCYGHYDSDTDSVTVYITNTSSHDADFQVCVGWSGQAEKPTSAESGYVTLKSGTTGKFVLENLYDYVEKTNDELQYKPGSHLSGSSVIRIGALKVNEGDSFVISGIEGYSQIRNTYFKEISSGAIKEQTTSVDAVTDSKRVITSDEDDSEENFGTTMVQPEDETVVKFITFVCASIVVGVGGIAVYTVSFILKRKKTG